MRSRWARATLGWILNASAISLTVFAPLLSKSDRIAALVGSDKTFAVRVAESSPSRLMAGDANSYSPVLQGANSAKWSAWVGASCTCTVGEVGQKGNLVGNPHTKECW
jgi:hypothetical protein